MKLFALLLTSWSLLGIPLNANDSRLNNLSTDSQDLELTGVKALLSDEDLPSKALLAVLQILEIPQQNNLTSIVEITQQYFIQKGKERWQFEERFADKRDALMPWLEKLGTIHTIDASGTFYEYALVLGGHTNTVQRRIDHLIRQFNRGVRFNHILFLTGERYIDPATEKLPPSIQTEEEMMILLWEKSSIPSEMQLIPLDVIHTDAPFGKTRPNTADTINQWLMTTPVPGTCLAISSQPWVGYQESVLRTLLPSTFSLETIGPQAPQDLALAIHLDNLARWLYQEQIRRQ